MNEQEFMSASDADAQAYAQQRGNEAMQSFMARAKSGGAAGVPKIQSDSSSSAGTSGEGDSMDKAKVMAAIQAGMKGGPEAILSELQKAGLKLDSGSTPGGDEDKEMDKEMDKGGGGNPYGGGLSGGPPGGGLAAMREKAAGMAMDKKHMM